jgi:molecular chaperone GrpE
MTQYDQDLTDDSTAAADAPTPGATPPAAPPAENGSAEDPAEVARQRDEFRDLLLRKSAEFDNYRKRVDRERREQAELAGADLIGELLPMLDNLDRALGSVPVSEEDPYRKGVELIRQQLLDILSRRGVAAIDPHGEPFDPHWHEAVVREAAPAAADGEVLEVFTRGYRIGNRLLRPAMVKVAAA